MIVLRRGTVLEYVYTMMSDLDVRKHIFESCVVGG